MLGLAVGRAWHSECKFAFPVNAMSRRDALPQRSARRSYVDPEEVYEDDPTRAARPSERRGSSRPPRPSAVDASDLADLPVSDPTELEVTRAPRESYVALAELPRMPAQSSRRSRAAVTDVAFEDEVAEDEVTSFVDRPSLVAASELDAQGPESVTTYAVRPSYIARGEQASYSTSELEEVAPSLAGDAIAQSEPLDYAEVSRFLFDDLPSMSTEAPDAEHYGDNGTLLIPPQAGAPESHRSYPRQPAMCIRQDPRPAAPPVQPTRRSRPSFHESEPAAPPPMRRSMPSMAQHDSAPAAPPPMRRSMPSHHSYEAAMQQFQAPRHVIAPMPMSSRRSMPSVHPHDSSAESPWIVPAAPSSRAFRRAPPKPASNGITASTVAAGFVALLAVGVMVSAILFVRSEETPDRTVTSGSAVSTTTFTPVADATENVAPVAVAPPPVIVISSDDIPGLAEVPSPDPRAQTLVPVTPSPVVAPTVAAPTAPPVPASPPIAKPVAATPAVTEAPARAAVSTKKADVGEARKKSGDKSVEDILKELGEQQLLR